MSKRAIQIPGQGGHHVAAAAAEGGLQLALCNAQGGYEVAQGLGLELALARAADGVTEAPPEWVQLLPPGPEIVARDKRRFSLPDAQAVLANFKANGADLPLDINHATEIKGPKGEEAPAKAWIKALAIRDGVVMGQVSWNVPDAEAVALVKAYRYLSPAMRHDKAGVVHGLSSAALVTHPALHMPALARSEGANPEEQTDMKTLAERLREALGLGADANDDAIVTAASSQVALARDARDISKLVPAADLQVALARASTAETALAALQGEKAEEKATALVEQAIAEGKIAPASKDHYLSLARSNFEGVSQVLAASPKVLTPPTDKGKKVEGGGDTDDANGLTADQVALCRQMGIEPKAYAETLKETA